MNILVLLIGIVVGIILGMALELITLGKNQIKKNDYLQDSAFKMHEFYRVLLQWLSVKQKGQNLAEYLLENNYHTIAIYGMKELGEALVCELEKTGVLVKYAIDKNAEDIYTDIKVLRPSDELEPVDAVIVTAIHYFDEIEIDMKEKMDCPIISLDDVVFFGL